MSFVPRVHEIYKHFKGDLYQITAIAEHTETGEQLVVYQAMYGEFKIYARPLEMFVSRVDKERYPDVTQEFRFALQGPDAARQQAEAIPAQIEEIPVQTEAISPQTEEILPQKEEIPPQADSEEELTLDPLLLQFLDSDSYADRLNILAALGHRITDEMITTMAIACDVEINDGDVQSRLDGLKNCLMTLERYECNRLR